MGKSVELLGLAAFNIMIAVILAATFMGNEGPVDAPTLMAKTLTERNVEHFINETAAVSGGQRTDMDSYSITTYLMNHVAENGLFTSTIEFTMPDMPSSSRTLEMDKMNFISHVLQGMKSMSKHETAVEIEHIEINEGGKTAMVLTLNYERGVMPVEDGLGEARMMPVTGTSYCEQELVISQQNIIQMAGAKCNTNIDFADTY